ncbi:hypothetical protein Ancab_037299 [Ancistrocladus abbreviatus]
MVRLLLELLSFILGQYMRTSEASYLSESYVFYEAILTREYFKEGLFQDHLIFANKQLRFLARFITVCLLLNRREMVHQLANQLKILLDECKRTFQDTNFREWKRNLRLQDAILSSYHANEVKFSELNLDTYRMLQCLEWEPSVLYRPSVTHFIAVLATVCEELRADGILLIYLSGKGGQASSPSIGSGGHLTSPVNDVNSLQSKMSSSDASSTCDSQSPTCREITEVCLDCPFDCIQIGARGNEGYFFKDEALSLTIDEGFDMAVEGKILSGAEKGESAAMLLSPSSTPPIAVADSSRQISGSLFTIFLTAPIQAFCLLLGFSGSDIEVKLIQDVYDNAEKLLSSSLNGWGMTLAKSGILNPVWAQVLSDPFLRRLILRFIFCRAVLALYAPTCKKAEFVPQCMPCLPEFVLPTAPACQSIVKKMANLFGKAKSFSFFEEIMPCESSQIDEEILSSS